MPAPDKYGPSTSLGPRVSLQGSGGIQGSSSLFPPPASALQAQPALPPADPPGDTVERIEQLEAQVRKLLNTQFSPGSFVTKSDGPGGVIFTIRPQPPTPYAGAAVGGLGQPNYYAYNTSASIGGAVPALADVDTALPIFYALPGQAAPKINDTINISWGNSDVLVLCICTGLNGPGNTVTVPALPGSPIYGFMLVGVVTD